MGQAHSKEKCFKNVCKAIKKQNEEEDRKAIAIIDEDVATMVDQFEGTLLHKCAECGRLAVAQVLVAKGANLEAKNDTGKSPLHVACHEGHLELIKVLVDAGANVNAQDQNGNTPLHCVVRDGSGRRKGEFDMAELLVNAGAEINSKNKWGQIPFDSARANYGIFGYGVWNDAAVQEIEEAYNAFKEAELMPK